MWRLRTSALIIIAIITVKVSPLVESIRFEMASGSSKCIMEDMKSNAMTIGQYTVVNSNPGYPLPDNHKINVRVMSPHKNNYHLADQVESGTFAFTAAEAGDYMVCFWAPHHKPSITLAVELDWKSGVAAESMEWSNLAKKGQLEAMEIELNKLYHTVISIHEEMFTLREREEEMQALNIATNSKMAAFGFLSLLVCLSVAGLQLWHLKTFFESKKLL